jgi:hypothetical protein
MSDNALRRICTSKIFEWKSLLVVLTRYLHPVRRRQLVTDRALLNIYSCKYNTLLSEVTGYMIDGI